MINKERLIESSLVPVYLNLAKLGESVPGLEKSINEGIRYAGHVFSKSDFNLNKSDFARYHREILKLASESVEEYCKNNSIPKERLNPELVKKAYEFLKDKDISYV